MPFRNDITINWSVSPRIITVAIPSIELAIQDLYDTLKELEQQQPNLIYSELISAAGKENLGSGTSVGLTATLLNAQVSFEARVELVSTGTVTTADTNGRILNDSIATFASDGVERGYLILNRTDGSACSVFSVTEVQLVTDVLRGGTDDEFGFGDTYDIYQVEQCNISGGNLVAVDDVDIDISSVFTSFGTQIIKTASSSATFQESADIRFSSFSGGVTVNTLTGTSGTVYPTGTPRQPVDNLIDALAIANERGLTSFYLEDSITIATLDFTNSRFVGHDRDITVTVDASAIVDGCSFETMSLIGILTDVARITNCAIGLASDFSGFMQKCSFTSTLTMGGSGTVDIIDCYSSIAGYGSPIIDMNMANISLSIRNYTGGLKLINKSGSGNASVDFIAGRLFVDNTVSGGTIVVRGVGEIVDTGTTSTLETNALINPALVDDELTTSHGVGNWAVTNDVEGLTLEETLRVFMAVLAGKMSVTNTGTDEDEVKFYARDDATSLVTGTVKDGVRIVSEVDEGNL